MEADEGGVEYAEYIPKGHRYTCSLTCQPGKNNLQFITAIDSCFPETWKTKKQKPKCSLAAYSIHWVSWIWQQQAAGAGEPKPRPTQKPKPGGRNGDLCRPLVASEPTKDEMAASLSSGPSRGPQCPRAPPSRLQGRDTCWVGAPSRASSHLTPSESPGAPHWQSFRYSGKDWWPLRPPTLHMGKGYGYKRKSLGSGSQGLSLTSPPEPPVTLATCEAAAPPHWLAHVPSRSGNKTLAKSETTLLSGAFPKFEEAFNSTKENKTLWGPGWRGFFFKGESLTDAFQTLIGVKFLTQRPEIFSAYLGQKPCHLGASREQLQTKNALVPGRCLAP